MATTIRFYGCDAQTDEGESVVTLSTREYGTCAQGTGSWHSVSVPGEFPTMDVVAMLIVAALVVCAALGWIAGHQR